MDTKDASGTLEEALERLHVFGPEKRGGWLSNHAPMTVEALVRRGHAPAVHRWLDAYGPKLAEVPAPLTPIGRANWREALGDARRAGDWIRHFERETAERPWRELLAEWWPRLLPGIAAGATHPAIRVGHAVRSLLMAEGATSTSGSSAPLSAPPTPLIRELAHGLGYWAARHQPLPHLDPWPEPVPGSARGALAAVPRVADQSGGIRGRLAQLTSLPDWPGAPALGPLAQNGNGRVADDWVGDDRVADDWEKDPEAVRTRLRELITAAVARYATHGHGEPVMLVHAATAPNAVLRVLPALPTDLWAPSLDAAWLASAAVTAAYAPALGLPATTATDTRTPGEASALAAAHGDEHAIKLTDTALDAVAWAEAAGDDPMPAYAAIERACATIDPLD
ncbi:questin oxidase family protein [Streptomyces sp. URMC 123]|uniref:questin oxidase family protein n=1 Tax=Streptomyces sp. URMC 123 TaxID=3423403 RepID=UPI003F1CC210